EHVGKSSWLLMGSNPVDAARRRSLLQRQDRHQNNFDTLRLIAAFLVVYGHSYPLTGNPQPSFAGNGVATIGVKIFFVISGYLVALSLLRDGNLVRFLIRRSLRILPVLGFVVLLTVAVLGPILTGTTLVGYFKSPLIALYLANIALYINYFLPGMFEHNIYPHAVNGSLWSLP